MQTLPMPPGKWVTGHVDELKADRLGLLLKMSKLGPISRVRALNRWIVLINDPDLIKTVLVDRHKDLVKSYGLHVAAKPALGEGILRSEGDLWRRQRRIMAAVFQPIHLDKFAHCMVDCAERTLSSWKPGSEIDLVPEMMRLSLSIVSKTLFGSESFDQAAKIGEAVTDAQHWVTQRMFMPIGMPLWLPTEMNRKFKAALALFELKMKEMIAARRGKEDQHDDLLSKLMAARDEEDGKGMSEQQLKDEVLNLFVAGHETTSSALAWSLHLLLENPAVLERLRADVDAIGARRIVHADLPRVEYARRVLKESIRLYPPAYMYGRTTTAPFELLGHTIPKGTSVMVSPYALHRRADLFPDPERFDPDRFTEEAEGKRARYAYAPFGGGPRVCIGQHYALLEGTLALATLVKGIDFKRVGNDLVAPDPLVTLKPNKVRVVVERRTHAAASGT